jgi:hypothetical protein
MSTVDHRAPRHAADAHVESVLGRMTLDELNAMQDVLLEQLRGGLPSSEHIARALERQSPEVAAWFRFREAPGEAVKVVMLLGALAVASAWLTHRSTPAPTSRLQDAIARVREDHVYMLPIPRSDPCFCGSGALFKGCHGKPPVAAPAV